MSQLLLSDNINNKRDKIDIISSQKYTTTNHPGITVAKYENTEDGPRFDYQTNHVNCKFTNANPTNNAGLKSNIVDAVNRALQNEYNERNKSTANRITGMYYSRNSNNRAPNFEKLIKTYNKAQFIFENFDWEARVCVMNSLNTQDQEYIEFLQDNQSFLDLPFNNLYHFNFVFSNSSESSKNYSTTKYPLTGIFNSDTYETQNKPNELMQINNKAIERVGNGKYDATEKNINLTITENHQHGNYGYQYGAVVFPSKPVPKPVGTTFVICVDWQNCDDNGDNQIKQRPKVLLTWLVIVDGETKSVELNNLSTKSFANFEELSTALTTGNTKIFDDVTKCNDARDIFADYFGIAVPNPTSITNVAAGGGSSSNQYLNLAELKIIPEFNENRKHLMSSDKFTIIKISSNNLPCIYFFYKYKKDYDNLKKIVKTKYPMIEFSDECENNTTIKSYSCTKLLTRRYGDNVDDEEGNQISDQMSGYLNFPDKNGPNWVGLLTNEEFKPLFDMLANVNKDAYSLIRIFHSAIDKSVEPWKTLNKQGFYNEYETNIAKFLKMCKDYNSSINVKKNPLSSIVSSAAGSGLGQFQPSSSSDEVKPPDYDYDNKRNYKTYQYTRNSLVTKTQPIETTLNEYNALAPSLMKTQTGLDKKTQNFCKCYITLINQFINFLISTTKPNEYNSNSIENLFNYILTNLQVEIEKNNSMFGGGNVTYNSPPKNNDPVTYLGNMENEKDLNKKNVIIVGAGPTGTYMGIILKLMAPDLEVYILENRIANKANEREMTRGENTINVKTTIVVASLSNFNNLIEKYDIDDTTFISQPNNFNLIPIDIVFDDKTINGNALSINKLEYALANYAQQIGILIFHTTNYYETHVNANTIGIFDATGGRLKEQTHYQFRVQNEQFVGDGLNINSLDFHNGKIPIICVGESLFKGNYLTGLGMNTICTMCFFISFLFTLTMGVKERYAETYKKFFGKDSPAESKLLLVKYTPIIMHNGVNISENTENSKLAFKLNDTEVQFMDETVEIINADNSKMEGINLVDYVDSIGNTPLHIAAYYGKKSIIEKLLGANAPNKINETTKKFPKDIAKMQGHTEDILNLINKDSVLVLCQRKKGIINNNEGRRVEKEVVPEIEKFVYKFFDKNTTIEYLTDGVDGDYDGGDHKFKLDDISNESKKFINEHIEHYSLIIFNTCPFMPYELIFKILKNDGLMALTAFSIETLSLQVIVQSRFVDLLNSEEFTNLFEKVKNQNYDFVYKKKIVNKRHCVGTYNMSWANEFFILKQLLKFKGNIEDIRGLNIEDIRTFINSYKDWASERTFLAQNDGVEKMIKEIDDILQDRNSTTPNQGNSYMQKTQIIKILEKTEYKNVFQYWTNTIEKLTDFLNSKKPSVVGLQEINRDSTEIKTLLQKVNLTNTDVKYYEIKETLNYEPYATLSIIIDKNVFGTEYKKQIIDTHIDESRNGRGRPLLLVLTKKGNEYFLFANIHGKNIVHETDKSKYESTVNADIKQKIIDGVNGFIRENNVNLANSFAMGDFNDKYDFIKELKFKINGADKTLSYVGEAPKSCCHNWDSSCDDNPREYIEAIGKCIDPSPHQKDKHFSKNRLIDATTKQVLPMSDGSKVEDYKYAGDKVFGLNPVTGLDIFNDNTSIPSIASDHELVYGYFQSSANITSNLTLSSNSAIVADSSSNTTSNQNIIIPIKTEMFNDQKHYTESISKQGITTTDLLDVTTCYYWNDSNNGTNANNNERVIKTRTDALAEFNERRKILFESDFFIVVAPHSDINFPPCVYVFSKDKTNANYKKIQNLKNNVKMSEINDPTEIDKSKILGDESVSIDGYSIMHIFCRHYGDYVIEYANKTDLEKMYLPQYKNKEKSTNSPNWVDLLVNLVPEMFDKIAFVEPTTIEYITNSHDVINSDKNNNILTELIAAKPNFFIEYTLNISIFWMAIINETTSKEIYVYVYDATNNVKTQIKIGKADTQVNVLLFEISKDAKLKYSTLYYCKDENEIDNANYNANCEYMFLYDKQRPLPKFAGIGTTKEIPLYELNKMDLLYLKIKNIEHVPLLGKYKMVATYDSSIGDRSNNFIKNVKTNKINLLSLEKKVNNWFKHTTGDIIDFKIYIDDSWTEGSGVSSDAAPKLVFYSNKYLTQLANLSGKTVKQLLELCATQQSGDTFNLDLVIIAFNFGGVITTVEGKKLFDKYVETNREYTKQKYPIIISQTLVSDHDANPGQNLGQTIGQDLNQNIGPDPSRTINQTPDQDPSRTINQTPDQDPSQTSNQTIVSNPIQKKPTIIGVIFKGMIPDEVFIVYSIPNGVTKNNLDDYITNIKDGSVTVNDGETVYFELTDKDEIKMQEIRKTIYI